MLRPLGALGVALAPTLLAESRGRAALGEVRAPALLAVGVWTPMDVVVLVRLGLLPGGTEVLRVMGVDVAGDAGLTGTW